MLVDSLPGLDFLFVLFYGPFFVCTFAVVELAYSVNSCGLQHMVCRYCCHARVWWSVGNLDDSPHLYRQVFEFYFLFKGFNFSLEVPFIRFDCQSLKWAPFGIIADLVFYLPQSFCFGLR